MSTPASPSPFSDNTVASSRIDGGGSLMAWADAALEQSRRIRAESLAVREHGRRLLQTNHGLADNLSKVTRAVKEARHLLDAATPPAVPEQPAGRAVETRPVPAPRRTRRNKLSHKNRWLISADVVAALARAGVACDIVVPGMDPVRDGYDPALPKH